MANTRIMNYRIDGTAALKASEIPIENHCATIVPFPSNNRVSDKGFWGISIAQLGNVLADKVSSVLEGSEMYCSLKYEDFHGCAYRLFSRKGIAVLSATTSIIAVVAIVVGS